MRLALFSDVNSPTTAGLIRATLEHAARDSGLDVVAMVTTRPKQFRRPAARRWRDWFTRVAVVAANPEKPWRSLGEHKLDLFREGRKRRIPLLTPDRDALNSPEFIAELRRFRPDVALSLGTNTLFRKPLRRAFARCINFHDGLVPDYRGIMATSFALLAGERRSGFAFHEMNARPDGGPVLHQDWVEVTPQDTLESVLRNKRRRAIQALPGVLSQITSGTGAAPQPKGGAYFSAHEWMAMIQLADPSLATSDQIRSRLRAFGTVYITIDGRKYPVTRVTAGTPGRGITLRTLDEQTLRADRFHGLPPVLARALGKLTEE